MFTAEPNENRKQTLNGQLSPSYEREWLETATKRVKTRHKKNHTHPTNNSGQTKIRQKKGMSTENNIGVQTRAMAQWVDNEANPEQVQNNNNNNNNNVYSD